MLRNMTITVSEEVARWARRKAAEENTSVSRLVGSMLENQMRLSDEYWRAYKQVRKLRSLRIDTAHRLTREEAHDRSGPGIGRSKNISPQPRWRA